MENAGEYVKDGAASAWSGIKGLMGKKTELEKLLDEAISNKNWGCSSTIKSRIARATFNYQDYSVVMKAVWTAIESKPYKWRIIFKGLSLLDYLLKHGNERVIEDARDRTYLLRSLTSFAFRDNGADKGSGVREKSKSILDLLKDSKRIRAQRKEAAKIRDKLTGGGGRSHSSRDQWGGNSNRGFGSRNRGFGSESSGYSSRSRDRQRYRDDDDDDDNDDDEEEEESESSDDDDESAEEEDDEEEEEYVKPKSRKSKESNSRRKPTTSSGTKKTKIRLKMKTNVKKIKKKKKPTKRVSEKKKDDDDWGDFDSGAQNGSGKPEEEDEDIFGEMSTGGGTAAASNDGGGDDWGNFDSAKPSDDFDNFTSAPSSSNTGTSSNTNEGDLFSSFTGPAPTTTTTSSSGGGDDVFNDFTSAPSKTAKPSGMWADAAGLVSLDGLKIKEDPPPAPKVSTSHASGVSAHASTMSGIIRPGKMPGAVSYPNSMSLGDAFAGLGDVSSTSAMSSMMGSPMQNNAMGGMRGNGMMMGGANGMMMGGANGMMMGGANGMMMTPQQQQMMMMQQQRNMMMMNAARMNAGGNSAGAGSNTGGFNW